MEELLASQTQTRIKLYRGKEVEGEIVAISKNEITVDLGAKSEGIIPLREFPEERLEKLKVGDKVQAFVHQVENESGQVVLSLSPRQEKVGGKGGRFSLAKFITAKSGGSKLTGKINEVNKGGLVVEVDNARGFLPNSQIGFEILNKLSPNNPDPVGLEIKVIVSEVDEDNNRLIFTQKNLASKEDIALLKKFSKNQKIKAEIIAVLPFALIVGLDGATGMVFAQDVSWDRIEDLSVSFKPNEPVEVLVTGLDEIYGRLDLSVKDLQEDPFAQMAEKYPADEVVKGEITSVSGTGINVVFSDGVEGFLPEAKKGLGTVYEVGKSMTFLVDGVDSHKRRVNLAPFVTSTVGLIYK